MHGSQKILAHAPFGDKLADDTELAQAADGESEAARPEAQDGTQGGGARPMRKRRRFRDEEGR